MRSLFFGWLTPCLWIFVLWEHIMSLPMGKCAGIFIFNTSLLCMVLCSAACSCLSLADIGTRENFCNILLSCKQSRSVHRDKFLKQLHRAVNVGKRAYLVRGLLRNFTLCFRNVDSFQWCPVTEWGNEHKLKPWELHLNTGNFFPVGVSQHWSLANCPSTLLEQGDWIRHSWEAPFNCWDWYCSIFLRAAYLPGPALSQKEQQESRVCIVTSRLQTTS